MPITLRNQVLKALGLMICLVLLGSHLAVPINLTSVDIGRHIKNGELLLQGQTGVLYKNFYSFTYPDYPFINHHWFFGVLSYLLFLWSGFKGLTVFFILLLTASFLLAFDSARRFSNFALAFFACVVSFLMVISRPEIRPEGISALGVALDFWLLQNRRFLPAVPVIQIFWVNTHIFFFMGPVLVTLFWWQARLSGASKAPLSFLKYLLGITLLACLINPSGIGGMLTPLNGFKQFGYNLAENQTVFFMMHRFPDNILYKYFLLPAVLLMAGMVLAWRREGPKSMPMILLGAFMTAAAFRAVRLIMPFGFLFIPLMGYFYAPYVRTKLTRMVLNVLSVMGLVYLCFIPVQPYIGLAPRVNASAEFFKQNGLKGPIFSNYDIGGYLIYHLQGQEKVFVDNRQEAFPSDFFRKTYIPMQEDPTVWKAVSQKYGFNIIYFDRFDLTPWGQNFLVARIQDPEWAPIFVDNYVIIFARRDSVDQGIIDRFELPKQMFGVIHNS